MTISIKQLKENMFTDHYLDLLTGEYFHIDPIGFRKDLYNYLSSFDPDFDFFIDSRTGKHYCIPSICFERDSLDDLIRVPDSNEYMGRVKKEFLRQVAKSHPDNTEMLNEINRLLKYDDHKFELHHDYGLFIDDYKIRKESFKYIRDEDIKVAIKWCNENGFEYVLD